MAAPNLVSVSSIYGKTKGAALGTSSADILTCAADKVYKINSIIISNNNLAPFALKCSSFKK